MDKYVVEITDEALDDMNGIYQYIAKHPISQIENPSPVL